ncbi:MAG: O-antigen ligase family protein, partial [Saprospiraceae bacterium]|nr:O-antigen ligase family protein [Saprospiraceae bacterium]
ALTLPLYQKIVPFFIALLILNWIIEGVLNPIQFKRIDIRFKSFFKQKNHTTAISFILLYLMYLTGMLYSANLEYGSLDLGIKLSFVVFPIIFLTINQDFIEEKQYKSIFSAFIIGCFISSIICLANAFYGYITTGKEHLFYYTYLSVFHHPSYLSMYINLCIIILIARIFNKESKFTTLQVISNSLLLFYLFVFVILLTSRSGIIGLILVYFVGIVYLIFVKRKILISIVILLSISLISFYSFKFLSYMSSRLTTTAEEMSGDKEIDKNSKYYNTNTRLLTWESALEIIKEHPVVGVGTGDARDELTNKYNEKEILPMLKKYLNVHNQFLQTFLTVGIIGFILLALSIIIPFINAIKNRDLILFVFVMLIVLNFAVESMLEVQAGVIFYSFFGILLTQKKAPQNEAF